MPAEVSMGGGVGPVGFTTDSSAMLAADGEVVRLWEIATRVEISQWVGHEPWHPILGEYDAAPRIHDVRLSEDGRYALTVGVDATLRVWEVYSGREVWKVTPDPCCVDWAVLSQDGGHVLWAGCPGLRLYGVR
jgi:hypothetical protein